MYGPSCWVAFWYRFRIPEACRPPSVSAGTKEHASFVLMASSKANSLDDCGGAQATRDRLEKQLDRVLGSCLRGYEGVTVRKSTPISGLVSKGAYCTYDVAIDVWALAGGTT